jgi:SAM-dependent methyltransferase
VDRWGTGSSRRKIERVLRRVFGRPRPLQLLDLGCGYHARLAQALEPWLERATCVDVAVAPSLKKHPRLRVLEGVLEKALPRLPAGAFDVVLLVSVLEHVGDPDALLKGCERVLKPGGLLLVNVPTWRGKFFLELSAFRLGLSPAQEMDDHKMYYDRRELWPRLIQAGFLPSAVKLAYYKWGLNLFATARKKSGTLR